MPKRQTEKKAGKKILSEHPDLIVSDVTMPELNGIDLCRKIKADNRTAHIPVILLTALSTEDQQLSGLETGASDYVTKPFNFEILLSKIRNLPQQQALSKNLPKTTGTSNLLKQRGGVGQRKISTACCPFTWKTPVRFILYQWTS